MYTNCDTLTNKICELKFAIDSNDPDIIVLLEVTPKNNRYILQTSELEIKGYNSYISNFEDTNTRGRGCASRSPEASQTQLGRVKAICDLARLASGIIVISVFNSLLTCFRLCTAWHAHTVFSYVYGTTRIRCLTHKLQQCLHTRTNAMC